MEFVQPTGYMYGVESRNLSIFYGYVDSTPYVAMFRDTDGFNF